VTVLEKWRRVSRRLQRAFISSTRGQCIRSDPRPAPRAHRDLSSFIARLYPGRRTMALLTARSLLERDSCPAASRVGRSTPIRLTLGPRFAALAGPPSLLTARSLLEWDSYPAASRVG